MDRILHMSTCGMMIRMTTWAGGAVLWEGSSILVNKIRVSMTISALSCMGCMKHSVND